MAGNLPRGLWYALCALLASQVALSAVTLTVALNAADKNAQKWCGTLRVFHESYQDTPPQTPAGQKIRDQIDDLYLKLDCAKVKEP